MSSLEVVMTAAVMVPLAVALLIFAIKMCNYLYRIAAAFVGWMFL